MALSGGIVLEEAVDLSSDRLLMNEEDSYSEVTTRIKNNKRLESSQILSSW
jgi:hypothetical protein